MGSNRIGRILVASLIVFGAGMGVVAEEEEIVGHWQGVLTVPGGELPVIFHIAVDEGGDLGATLDSPNQGAIGIQVSDVTFADNHLSLKVAAIAGGYEGDLEDDGKIHGLWSQGGANLDLELERTEEPTALAPKPQEPKPPYPYSEHQVTVAGPQPSVTLAGTLTLPEGAGPHPAVILITGSGPQNRDEELLGHKPFLVLADYLTRRGIAVLRMDDRGVGESTCSFAEATSMDFADDIESAVGFLRERADIGEIGLVGHSEGGLVAPIVANRTSEVGFVLLMAGPGLTGEEILYLQSTLIIKANGGTDAAAAANNATQKAMFEILKQETDLEVAKQKMTEPLREALASAGVPEEAIEAQVQAQITEVASPWFKYFLTYDPAPALRTLECPVLAVFGEKDTQVPPTENIAAIRAALEEGGHTDYELLELPGRNHLFQTADTGSPSEYATIEETIAPLALETISDWILKQVLDASQSEE